MKVRARAPLRLGLAGGGTDVSPYCDEHGGLVLNAAIGLHAYATLAPAHDGRLRFAAVDRGEREDVALAASLDAAGPLCLHRGVYNRVVRDFRNGEPLAIELSTHSDAPAGSGLGASSTLVVAMVKAFVELLALPLGEYDIARLAYEIERNDLQLAGGRQDQYAAAFGGVNFMEFHAGERVVVNPLRVKNWILSELEASLALYYTGVSRDSARIIAAQKSLMAAHDPTQRAALDALKDEALAMKEHILRGDIRALAASMRAGWDAKKRVAPDVSSAPIEQAVDTALAHGAYAAKASGAGGGGFIMLLADPLRMVDLRRALDGLGMGRTQACHFTPHGTQAWRIE